MSEWEKAPLVEESWRSAPLVKEDSQQPVLEKTTALPSIPKPAGSPFKNTLLPRTLETIGLTMSDMGKNLAAVVADLGLMIGGQPTMENIRAAARDPILEPLPLEKALTDLKSFGGSAAKGILSVPRQIPALGLGAAAAPFVSPYVSFPATFGVQTYGETRDFGEAGKAAVTAGLFPVVGKLVKPLASKITDTLLKSGFIKAGNETALKTIETVTEQIAFQATAHLVSVPEYIKATPEERSRLFAEHTASLMVFAVPGILKTADPNVLSDSTKLKNIQEQVKKDAQDKILSEMPSFELPTPEKLKKSGMKLAEAKPPPVPREGIPFDPQADAFALTDPSGMKLSFPRIESEMSPGVKAGMEMLDLLPGARELRLAQRVPEIVSQRNPSAVQPQTISPVSRIPEASFENDPTIRVPGIVSETPIPLSERIGERERSTIYVDEKGRAGIGPKEHVDESGRLNLTLDEQLKREAEVERQIDEALYYARKLPSDPAEASRKSIDKSLPPRKPITPEQSRELATELQQRVPPEPPPELLSEISRPAEAQAVEPSQSVSPTTETSPLKSPLLQQLEIWADRKIEESRGRSFTGLDPELLAARAVKGAILLTKGITSFSEWSARMIQEFGDSIKPHLNLIRKKSEEIRNGSFREENKTETKTETRNGNEPSKTTTAQPKAEVPPEESKLLLNSKERFSDFQDRETSKKLFGVSFGAEKIPVIGKLFGPRANIKNDVIRAIITTFAEYGVGKAKASSFGLEIQNTIDPLFPKNEKGEITNIGRTRAGQSLHQSDVFESLQENPNSYTLSPEQRSVFNRMQQIESELKKLEDKNEIFQDSEGNYIEGAGGRRKYYHPRIVIERPGKEKTLPGSSRPGAEPGFKKSRAFKSEQEGVNDGYKYEPSIEKRMVSRVERLYKAIADKRLAKDPSLSAPTRKQYESALREHYTEEIASGEMTEGHLQRIIDNAAQAGRVNQPAFQGRILPKETADALNKYFPNADSTARRRFASVNEQIKAIRLGFDLGVSQIQGLVLANYNPRIWAQSQWEALRAFKNPKYFAEYAKKNIQYVRELADMGSSVGSLPEYLAGIERPLIQKIPLLGRFGRHFQTFLDVAKVELYKSAKEITPPEQRAQMVQTIESLLTTSRMETAGVSSRRAFWERALLLAPSYYRGAVNLVGAMGEKGVSGSMARRAMLGYAAGGLATFVGVAYQMGMSEDEIVKRLNPAEADFMMWDFKTDEGRTIKFGFGGIHRSFLKLAGNIVKTSIEHPGNWLSLSSEKNPITRWLRGHSSGGVSLAWDAFSGRDFMGRETDVGTLAQGLVPLIGQVGTREVEALRRPGENPPEGFEYGMSFLGVTAYPASLASEKKAAREEMAQKRFKKSYDDLRIGEMARVAKEVDALPQFFNQEYTERSRELKLKSDEERLKRISKSIKLGDEIKESGLRLSSIDPSISRNGNRVPLSKNQVEKLEKYVIEEYDRFITSDRLKRIERLDLVRRQKVLDELMSNAKDRARGRLLREIR